MTQIDQVQATLKRIWGYDAFRPPQEAIVRSILAGQDTVVLMPTGGGKSICFQLPALLQPGVTLVVSPLVALMENQVQALRQRQLPAALLHNQVSARERQQTFQSLQRQQLRLLYLSPETLLSPAVWEQLQSPTLPIVALVLDEAHCLTQWGDTFRPAYYRLGAVRPALLQTKPPGTRMAIAAFTATADPQAYQTIERILGLRRPTTFKLSPYRPNLHLRVQTVLTPRGRLRRLGETIQAHAGQTGLVYVRTRRDSEALAATLQEAGLATAPYHAGLGAADRRRIEQAWLAGDLGFVICTCAFGMGIDKPDVRWVIHYQAPLLLSEYIQEAGRGGRDGHPADILTLVSEPTGWLDPEDRQRWQYFETQTRQQQRLAQQLVHQLPSRGTVEAISRQFDNGALALAWLHGTGQLQWDDPFQFRLGRSTPTALAQTQTRAAQQMMAYLRTRHCRWQFLLQAFGFPEEAATLRCGQCDNCRRAVQPAQ